MANVNYKEDPFKYLRRKNGEFFSEEIRKNWYIARRYVLDLLAKAETEGMIPFLPDSKEYLQVVVGGDSPAMLAVIRQIALQTHYVNYKEDESDEACRNRTVITIVSKNPRIKEELEKEECLCNLPRWCKYVQWDSEAENINSFVDIEIHVVSEYVADERANRVILIKKDDVESFFEEHDKDPDFLMIDTRKAEYASRMYRLGTEFYNLPAEDIHCAKRYALALDVFQYKKLKNKFEPMFSDAFYEQKQCKLKESLSNVFCADCFESRAKTIELISEGDIKKEKELWPQNNEVLSKSEHARWNVEKLIMGYRPLNEQERYQYEKLHVQFGSKDKKKAFRDQLKHNDQDPAHIDLCSYIDLRRVNPDDMKFDSFLMLAIPEILKKIKGQ